MTAAVVARAVRWPPLIGASMLSIWLLVWQVPGADTSDATLGLLRRAALLLAIGAAFAFDDAAAAVTSAAPRTLAQRLTVRAGLVCVPAIALWSVAIFVVETFGSTALPASAVAGVSGECACALVGGLAIAASLRRLGGIAEPGQFAGPALVAVSLGLLFVPVRWQFIGDIGPQWTAAHQRWAFLGLVVVAALVLATRDPAARPIARVLRRR